MAAVQLREFTTGAEMMAHYALIRAKRLAVVAPQRPVIAPTLPPDSTKPASAPCAPSSLNQSPGTQEPKWTGTDAGPLTVATIIEAVCKFYKIPKRHLLSNRRSWNVVRPRQAAMYLARKLTGHTMTSLGRLFGGFDHTTVLHAINKTEELMALIPRLKAELAVIEFQLMPAPVVVPDTADPNQLALPLAGEAG